MLSDKDIRKYWGSNGIDIFTDGDEIPFDGDNQIQPSSVDLRFRRQYNRFSLPADKHISVKHQDYTEISELKTGEPLIIQPGE
ncbi:MAG: hypothetical protein LBS19_02675 [Clostridiales bacterium]|nr:hypothetical protein [Clostridiales bacterium]